MSHQHGRLSDRLYSRHICEQSAALQPPQPSPLTEAPSPTQYSAKSRQSSAANIRHKPLQISIIVRHTKHWNLDSAFEYLSDSPSHSPGHPSIELSSDQTSELSGELRGDLAIEVRTWLPVEVPVESRAEVWSDLSVDWRSDVPVEWLIEVAAEWWVESWIEVWSKVPTEMPIELPSPEISAELGCESACELMGVCGAEACWNSCGLSDLR